MPADVRDVSVAISDGPGTIARPGGAQVGDVLILFASTWVGPISAFGPPSGDWGAPIAERTGVDNGGVRVWRRTMTSGEPATYSIPVPESFADCTFAILAVKNADAAALQVAVSGESGVNVITAASTPGITPTPASSLEIRFVSGVPDGSDPADSLGAPAGYEPRASQRASFFVLSALATRSLVSSAPVGAAAFPAIEGKLRNYVGVTIIIGSKVSSGGPPPTPPTFPAFTPTAGDAEIRYTVHDYLTGSYVGDLPTVRQVRFGRRIGQETSWDGFVPLPSRREADQLAEIIPRGRTELATGPGRLVVHSWRGGALWGMHWLTDALPARSVRGGVGVQLRGTTLDGHWQRLYPTSPPDFDGDLLEVFRAVITDMQATGSNLGLSCSAGTAGVSRPLTADDTGTSYGQLLQTYARAGGGLEYVLNPTVVGGSIQRLVKLGAPKISNTDTEHVFSEGADGGDITAWRIETSALRGGTRFGVTGGTPPADDVTSSSQPVRSTLITTEHVAAGWPIYDMRINHPGASIDPQVVQDYAAYAAARAGGAPSTFAFDVLLGKESTFGPNSCGDWAKFVLENPWFPPTDDGGASFNLRQRIIGWELTPAERGSGGKDRLTLITDQEVEL
ncbi:hypothetical protein Skr01_36190 [Sphaerisporangium krabiense]|uniref:Uncharacterized protein n=1 Tax=Sphaerisporangium krabiense TaxID=763782 RepID=A0A7W8Z3C9_9ACTN|nr:hypothetical protein [Sphaerisporangium krabiense]MBB5626612.1 hypothetical protein [Sphaerisporangium krabiense]GII63534.1 hypothetical protein Skr01_36190 [Sphaerisporangium krabiense]